MGRGPAVAGPGILDRPARAQGQGVLKLVRRSRLLMNERLTYRHCFLAAFGPGDIGHVRVDEVVPIPGTDAAIAICHLLLMQWRRQLYAEPYRPAVAVPVVDGCCCCGF